MVKKTEELSEEEKKALRGSKFAPLPSLPPSSSRSQPRFNFTSNFFLFLLFNYFFLLYPCTFYSFVHRLAHPGGPLTTNKAAALAKFLERKLKDPEGLSSINPDLLELAVKNAKDTVISSTYFFCLLIDCYHKKMLSYVVLLQVFYEYEN